MLSDNNLSSLYPHIRFAKHWTLGAESHYLLGSCHAIVDAICQLPLQPNHRRQLLHVSLIKGARATTAIEGNTLTDAEVEKVSGGESLTRSKEYQEREVRNILDAMNLILSAVADEGEAPLISMELMRRFHRYVGKDLGAHFDAVPGQFRTDERTVGPYKCPRGRDVEDLLNHLCAWLPVEFGINSGQTFAQAVVQAIVTHVYLEWIHPFGDGNGRTGRLLEFYVLLRGGNPDLASHSLSNHYNETRSEYYRQLDQATKTRDLSEFLRYAIQGYYDGLKVVFGAITEDGIETAWRYLVHTRFAEHTYRKTSVHKRRRRLALELPLDEALTPDRIVTLSSVLAREYGALSVRTLLRDLAEFQEMGIVGLIDGALRVNLGLLVPHMVRRRVPDGITP